MLGGKKQKVLLKVTCAELVRYYKHPAEKLTRRERRGKKLFYGGKQKIEDFFPCSCARPHVSLSRKRERKSRVKKKSIHPSKAKSCQSVFFLYNDETTRQEEKNHAAEQFTIPRSHDSTTVQLRYRSSKGGRCKNCNHSAQTQIVLAVEQYRPLPSSLS